MIDYKQTNPDHTMDQFNKALKELDPEIRKVWLPFFYLKFTPLTNFFLFMQTYDARSKALKAAKAGPYPITTSATA